MAGAVEDLEPARRGGGRRTSGRTTAAPSGRARRTTAARGTDVAEVDVGRRDLEGDVVGQPVEALGDGVDDAGGHRVERARDRRRARGGGCRRRPPARARGRGRSRTATGRRAGRAARRPSAGAISAASSATVRRSSPARVEDARLGVGGDGREAGDDADASSTSAGWRAATARAWTAPADQPSTAQLAMPRWAASAAASSANVPTVPVGVR